MRYSDYTLTPSGLQYKDVKVAADRAPSLIFAAFLIPAGCNVAAVNTDWDWRHAS